MRKLIIIAVAFAMALTFVSVAVAQGGGESEVYWQDENGVWQPPRPVAERNARLFRLGEPIEGNCNKVQWEVPVRIHASIAQWIKFRLAWNEWQWFVRKPGCYAGNSIEAVLASNGDVLVDYSGFDNLMPVDQNPDKTPINIAYSFEYMGGGFNEANDRGWTPAPVLNDDDDLLEDIPFGPNGERWPLHFGVSWKLWNRICVVACNTACEYQDEALITLILRNQKPWIEPETGAWGTLF